MLSESNIISDIDRYGILILGSRKSPSLYSATTKQFKTTICTSDSDDNLGQDLIVNCTSEVPSPQRFTGGRYIRLAIPDNYSMNDSMLLLMLHTPILSIIESFLISGKRVLVHCYAGIQRSAAVVCCYLMKYHHKSKSESVQFIKERRTVVFVDPGGSRGGRATFEEAMSKFERLKDVTVRRVDVFNGLRSSRIYREGLDQLLIPLTQNSMRKYFKPAVDCKGSVVGDDTEHHTSNSESPPKKARLENQIVDLTES